jgi:hypothetical protein
MEIPDPTAPLATRLRNARNYLAAAGFQSASDVLLDELNDKSAMSRRELKVWFDTGNFTKLIDAAIAHRSIYRLSYDENLCKAMLPIIQQAIEREVCSLSDTLGKPLRSYSPKDIAAFNFSAIKEELAPTLLTLLQGVVGKAPEAQEADVQLGEPDEEDNERRESQSTNTQTRRNKPLMVKFALSLLCYARSKGNNLVPGHIGYFLVASSTGKRTIDALHKLGVCIAYESVLRIQKVSETIAVDEPMLIVYQAIADAAKTECREKASQLPWIISYDNMNYMASVKTLLLHKTPHLQNDTAAYVYFLPNQAPESAIRGLLPKSAIKRELAMELTARDLLPPGPELEGFAYYQSVAEAQIVKIIEKHFGMPMRARLRKDKEEGIMSKSLHPLETHQTDIYTLPTLELNEAKIDETVEIIKSLMEELDIPLENLHNKLAMFKGDWLTIRNITSALFQRQDSISEAEKLDFVEPVMGLFHLQMNVLKVMLSNYWGRADGKDLASVQHFVRTVGNNRVKKDCKDFRACHSFMNDLLDAHVLAACFSAAKVTTAAEFAARLATIDWRAMIKRVAKDAYSNQVDSMRYDEMRQPIPIEERDITWENANLFLRDMLVFREYEDAVKAGDTGRIEHVIYYWGVIFQGTKLSNYPNEMVHLVGCLRKIWGPELKQQWLDNCLVNPSGKAGAWMPDDMFGEYVVRENKKRQRPSTNATSGDFNKEINARQVMCFRYSRSAIYTSTDATDYYMRSAQADSWMHIQKFYTELLNARVFTRTESRYKLREQDEAKFYVASDLYISGALQIGTGEPVAKYKARARCTWSMGCDVDLMPSVDENDGELLDGYELDVAEDEMLESDTW